VLLAYEEAECNSSAEERKRLLTFVVVGGGPTGAAWGCTFPELL